MTNNSTKLFQKAIKIGLFTAASTAALLLGSSGTLGAALQVTANVPALGSDDDTGLSAPWQQASNLTLEDNFNITTGADNLNIAFIDVNGKTGTFTVRNNNIIVAGDGIGMNVTLTEAAGTVFVPPVTEGGNVSVAAGELVINIGENETKAAVDGNVTITGGKVHLAGVITGDLVVSGGGNLVGDNKETNVTGKVTLQADAGNVSIAKANGAVTVAGGTLTLKVAGAGINFSEGAAAVTTVNVVDGGNVGDVDNMTDNDGIGTINFVGNGAANNLGATNALAEVIFYREVTIAGTTNAQTITINNGAADVIATGAVTGAVNFVADGKFMATKGITGAVTAANGRGTLKTAGNITGAIGAKGNSLKVLNVGVNDGNDATLGGNVYALTVNFGDANYDADNAVGNIQVAGDLIATTLNFGNNAQGGTLTFNGAAAEQKLNVGAINNGVNAVLNVNTTLLTTSNAAIENVKTINFGAGAKGLSIETDAEDFTLLDKGQKINISNVDSTLTFKKVGAGNINLADNLPSVAGVGGHLVFSGGATQAQILKVTGTDGTKNIGANDALFTDLKIQGFVNTKNLDLTNIGMLNIDAGANFLDSNNTASNIPQINIGTAAGAGTYIIDAQDGAVAILNNTEIRFEHADSNLTLRNSAAGDGTITLNAVLDPGTPRKGILTLDSGTAGGKIIVVGTNNATYGTQANPLKQLNFSGTGKFQINNTVGVFADGYNLSITAIDYGADINGDLTFSKNTQLNLTGNINGNVDFKNQAAVITLGANNNITGSVTSTGGVNGTIIASGASTIKGPITNVAMLKVGAGAVKLTAGGDYSITEIQGNGTELLTLPANFKLTGGFNLTGGQALKLSFAGGSNVSGAVGTNANPVGDITLAGTNTFTGGMNSNGNVTLAQNSVTNFAGNIKATSFAANNATLNCTNTSAFNGNITGSGTTIALGSTQVTYTGKSSFKDVLTLNTTYDGATQAGGNILIKSGSNIDLSQLSSLDLSVTVSNVNLSNINQNAPFKLITSEAAGGLTPVSNDKIKVTINGNENRFVEITVDTSNLTLFATNIASRVINEDFENELANIPDAAAVKQSFKLMDKAPEGSDANLALSNFGEMTTTQAVDAVNHLRQNSVKQSEVIAACSQVVSGNIFNNLASINTRVDRIQAANNFAAVPAGDEDMDAKFGSWVNPFIGNATQKKKNNISGYKSDITGGTIGFDGMINDDAVLGLAYTRAETDVKLKDAKKGDKNKVHSNIYSLYGLYNLPNNNFFVAGVASYGDSKVRTKSQRNIAIAKDTIGYQTANGKYKSENYTGQLMVGYNYTLPATVSGTPLVVTPLAGLRYSDIKDKGYKETGTTYQNLIVKGKNYNTFDGLVGAKLSSSINTGEVMLIPELHALVDYAFKNKALAIDARLQGMAAPYTTNSFKPSKTSFDLGVGVTIKHKMMEYGLNYDANIASKYFAQQGSLKVRVNF